MATNIDIFDQLMNTTCTIARQSHFSEPGTDDYGQPDQTLITIITTWPCRVSSKGTGIEYKIGKELAKTTHVVFMRPPTQDDLGAPFDLSPRCWLVLSNTAGATLNGIKLNVLGVKNPAGLNHHLECDCEELIP